MKADTSTSRLDCDFKGKEPLFRDGVIIAGKSHERRKRSPPAVVLSTVNDLTVYLAS